MYCSNQTLTIEKQTDGTKHQRALYSRLPVSSCISGNTFGIDHSRRHTRRECRCRAYHIHISRLGVWNPRPKRNTLPAGLIDILTVAFDTAGQMESISFGTFAVLYEPSSSGQRWREATDVPSCLHNLVSISSDMAIQKHPKLKQDIW